MDSVKSPEKLFPIISYNINEVKIGLTKITTTKRPWAVSMALFGQEFMHFIQLSHFKVQKGLPLIILIALTGHCFMQSLQLSHLYEA